MKPILLAVLAVSLTLPAWAQEAPPPAAAPVPQADPAAPPADPAGAPPGDPAGEPPKKSREELKKLLAPIALYPDAILAPVLTACTTPPDIVLAKRYLDAGKSAAAVDTQPWDASVKTLVRYPAVLKKLDADLERTTRIGEAFTFQQQEVMEVVQELRQAAYDKGNLRTNDKQRVVRDESYIRVEPVAADYFYVPDYDPEVVYYRDYNPVAPFITYGAPLVLGAWLYHGFDWRSRYVGYYRPGYWRRGVGYAAGPGFVAGRPANGFNRWTPNVNRPGVYQQRAAAVRAAGRVPGNPAAGFVPGTRPGVPPAGFVPGTRPGGVPPAAFRPGTPGAPGAAVVNPNSRAAREAAAREARATRAVSDRQAREARVAASQQAQASRATAAREARVSRDAARAAQVKTVPQARAPKVQAPPRAPRPAPQARAPRSAPPQVRAPRPAPQARAPRAPQARAPKVQAAPRAPKAAPAAKAPKKQKP